MNRMRDDKNRRSPILRDLIPGTGGLGTGWFSTNGTEGLSYDATSNILGTEGGVPVVNESGTPIVIS